MRPYPDWVVIHDGVRPLVSDELLQTCIQQAKKSGACISSIPVSDTLKQVTTDALVASTINRDGIWLAQTPQVFRYRLIFEAHQQAFDTKPAVTDDAMLLERMDIPVAVVRGSKTNLKVTTPEDLILAEALIASGQVDIRPAGDDSCRR
jgi:2-C-methyl-D-erythritol 4-phosphate cytidylyltransferase